MIIIKNPHSFSSEILARPLVFLFLVLPQAFPSLHAERMRAVKGFKEVYSNDRQFLAAAAHFGLKGLNVIEPNKGKNR